MGSGDDDRLVVITDGQPLMHLVFLWRDAIPEDWVGEPLAGRFHMLHSADGAKMWSFEEYYSIMLANRPEDLEFQGDHPLNLISTNIVLHAYMLRHEAKYRDWIIDAFNDDLPYDEFLVQQIAADRLDLGDDRRPLAAMGFLTLGERFLQNPHDIIDDRIDVVTRGTMALTVSCARCHDHKFDPIPTEDYYALAGFFTSTESSDTFCPCFRSVCHSRRHSLASGCGSAPHATRGPTS